MLPGAHRTTRWKGKAPNRKLYVYWLAWRGRGAPVIGSFNGRTVEEVALLEQAAAVDLAAKYAEARKSHQQAPGFMSSLIADYRSDAFPQLAPSTQRVWKGHIDKIEAVFGETSLKAMQVRGARKLIKRWHEKVGKPVPFKDLVAGKIKISPDDHARLLDQWQDIAKPDTMIYTQARTANIRLTVLTRILSFGVDEETIDKNPASGIKRLDEGPGRAAITWSDGELSALLSNCPPHVGRAVRLAAMTGLRLADVVTLNWSEVEEFAIVRPTLKSRRKQRGSIPLYPDLRALLDEFPRVGPKVVTSSYKRPWKNADSFDSSLRPALKACGVKKHFHDLRGTACTFMYRGGLEKRAIALALGWSESEVEERINDYVDLAGAARAFGEVLLKGRSN